MCFSHDVCVCVCERAARAIVVYRRREYTLWQRIRVCARAPLECDYVCVFSEVCAYV